MRRIALFFVSARPWEQPRYQEQEQMFAHLAHFDVSAASCSSDFDREFILSAVSQWQLGPKLTGSPNPTPRNPLKQFYFGLRLNGKSRGSGSCGLGALGLGFMVPFAVVDS